MSFEEIDQEMMEATDTTKEGQPNASPIEDIMANLDLGRNGPPLGELTLAGLCEQLSMTQSLWERTLQGTGFDETPMADETIIGPSSTPTPHLHLVDPQAWRNWRREFCAVMRRRGCPDYQQRMEAALAMQGSMTNLVQDIAWDQAGLTAPDLLQLYEDQVITPMTLKIERLQHASNVRALEIALLRLGLTPAQVEEDPRIKVWRDKRRKYGLPLAEALPLPLQERGGPPRVRQICNPCRTSASAVTGHQSDKGKQRNHKTPSQKVKAKEAPIQMCTYCNLLGHVRRDCRAGPQVPANTARKPSKGCQCTHECQWNCDCVHHCGKMLI